MPKKRVANITSGQGGNTTNRIPVKYQNELLSALREPHNVEVSYKFDEIIRDDIKEFKEYVLQMYDTETSEDKIVERFIRTSMSNDIVYQNWKQEKAHKSLDANQTTNSNTSSIGSAGEDVKNGTKNVPNTSKNNNNAGLPSDDKEESDATENILETMGG